LIGDLRVPLDFAQAGVASNRGNLVHCAPSLSEASRSGLAQPMMFVFGGSSRRCTTVLKATNSAAQEITLT